MKRVLETTAASTLQHPKITLERSIYRNAGHSLKILSQIDAADVVDGEPSAVGAMLGLIYQEYFRVVALETSDTTLAGSMDKRDEPKQENNDTTLRIDIQQNSELRGPASSPIMTETTGQPMHYKASVSRERTSFKPTPAAKRRGQSLFPANFKKDPRDARTSTQLCLCSSKMTRRCGKRKLFTSSAWTASTP